MTSASRIPSLDGLRGLSVAMVVAHHYWGVTGNSFWQRLLQCGWVGVDLFFVLSGFLITRIVLQNSGGKRFLSVFFLRRFLRTFLPYYFFLVFAFVTAVIWELPLRQAPWGIFALHLQAFFMAVTNQGFFPYLGVAWSLSWEELFYFVLPLFAARAGVQNLHRMAIFGLALAPALRWLHSAYYPVPGDVILTIRPDGLFWGVLLAQAQTSSYWGEVLRSGRRVLQIGVVVLGAGYLAVSCQSADVAPLSLPAKNVLYFTMAVWSFFVVALAVQMPPKSLASRLLVFSPLRYVGKISFSIYLYHQLFAFWTGRLYPSAPAFSIGMALAVTFLWAAKSWEWWEGPLVRLGHRYDYSRCETPRSRC